MAQYGLSKNQKVGLSVIVLIVFIGVIMFVPITTETTVVQCFAPPCPPIVESKTLFDILTTPEPEPIACILIFAPVCGVNGETFSNSCFAEAEGVEIAHDGECPVGSNTGEMLVSEPASTFCRIYPTASGC